MRFHTARVFFMLALCGLAMLLWLQGDADEVHPPAPASRVKIAVPTWGVEDPLTRLLPIDSYAGPLGGPLALAGARNEVVDQQLVLLAAARPWTGVHLTFSDLRGPQGATLSQSLLHWRRVGLVRTQRPYYQTRYVGLWPDPLLPPAPFDVAAHGRAFAWVDLRVPVGTRPGRYTGTITLSSQSDAPKTVSLTLHVWGFTLPRQNHLQTSFGVQGQAPFPLDMDAMQEDMLDHRIMSNNAVGNPHMVSPPSPGHPAQWDWTQYDRNVNRRLAQGLTAFQIWMPDPKASVATAWAQGVQAHLQEKGWLGLAYTYLADEPESRQLAEVNAKLGAVKQVAPELHNLMTAKGYPPELTNVDIWCPEIVHFDPDGSQREQARGCASWWYPAYSTQHPEINVWTDYPALDCRVWPWMTWKYNLDGMLYWSVCSWQNTADPLTQSPAFGGGYGPANGDGALVYPGPGGKPLDSIRWEALRDGMQDYEVFCMLEAGVRELQAAHKAPTLVRQAQALLAIDPSVVSSYKDYNSDPHALLDARQQMSVTVEKIVTALGHEPRITLRPRLHPEIAALQAQALAAQSLPAKSRP